MHYSLTTSPFAKDQTRVTFDLSIPSNFKKVNQRLNKRRIKEKFIHSLLQYPIYCNGSCFQLQNINIKKGSSNDYESGKYDCSKIISPEPSNLACVTTLCTQTNISHDLDEKSPKNFIMMQVYTDFISPRPEYTANAIALRLNQRFLNQVHEYENIQLNNSNDDYCDENDIDDNCVKTGIDMAELCIIS